MDDQGRPTSAPHRRLAVVFLALAALLPATAPARADGAGAPAPLPRVALVLDTESAVVIAMHQKLYAFLDTMDGNNPIQGADVQITIPRAVLPLREMSPGIYVSDS